MKLDETGWCRKDTRQDKTTKTAIEGVHTFRLSPCFSFTVCMNLYMPVSLGLGGSHNFFGVAMTIIMSCVFL